MREQSLAAIAVVLAAAAPAADAILVKASTSEAISFRWCVAGATACDDVSSAVEIDYAGLPGGNSSSVTGAVAGIGTASGAVALSGVVGAPVLHGVASSDAGARTNTTAFALQSYVYTGTAPATRTFGGTLTYSQSLTGPYPSAAGGGINAGIDVFTLSIPSIEVGSTPQSNFGALFSYDTLPGYTSLASVPFQDASSNPSGLAKLDATLTLTPGQTVWVFVVLQTPAPNGSSVDASHTFVTGWDDPTALVPAPEPGTWATMLVGLAALAGLRRRA